MKALWNRILEEPAVGAALLTVVIALVAPRLGLSAEEVGYLTAAVAAIAGIGVRQSVTPDRKTERLGQGPQFNPDVDKALGRGQR